MNRPPSEGAIQRPTSRYGRARLPRRPGRRAVIGLTAVAIAAGTAVAVIAHRQLDAGEVKGSLAAYQLIDDETVSVTVSVTRSDPARPVVCIVRSRSMDGAEAGRREVLVGPSQATTVRVTAIVKSAKPPVVGDVYGCGAEVPGYLRSP